MKILIVDDDRDLTDILSYALKMKGYSVITATDGTQGIERFRQDQPDLIILDLTLPKMDGFEVCKTVRQESTTPIIMLTVRASEEDTVTGFRMGADDYVAKPFSPRLLIARIEAVLRRAALPAETDKNRLIAGSVVLDPQRNEVSRGPEKIKLTPLEFRLLRYLVLKSGEVVQTTELVERVWGYEGGGDNNLVRTHIRHIREKLEEDPSRPRYLKTVPGVGYTFAPD